MGKRRVRPRARRSAVISSLLGGMQKNQPDLKWKEENLRIMSDGLLDEKCQAQTSHDVTDISIVNESALPDNRKPVKRKATNVKSSKDISSKKKKHKSTDQSSGDNGSPTTNAGKYVAETVEQSLKDDGIKNNLEYFGDKDSCSMVEANEDAERHRESSMRSKTLNITTKSCRRKDMNKKKTFGDKDLLPSFVGNDVVTEHLDSNLKNTQKKSSDKDLPIDVVLNGNADVTMKSRDLSLEDAERHKESSMRSETLNITKKSCRKKDRNKKKTSGDKDLLPSFVGNDEVSEHLDSNLKNTQKESSDKALPIDVVLDGNADVTMKRRDLSLEDAERHRESSMRSKTLNITKKSCGRKDRNKKKTSGDKDLLPSFDGNDEVSEHLDSNLKDTKKKSSDKDLPIDVVLNGNADVTMKRRDLSLETKPNTSVRKVKQLGHLEGLEVMGTPEFCFGSTKNTKQLTEVSEVVTSVEDLLTTGKENENLLTSMHANSTEKDPMLPEKSSESPEVKFIYSKQSKVSSPKKENLCGSKELLSKVPEVKNIYSKKSRAASQKGRSSESKSDLIGAPKSQPMDRQTNASCGKEDYESIKAVNSNSASIYARQERCCIPLSIKEVIDDVASLELSGKKDKNIEDPVIDMVDSSKNVKSPASTCSDLTIVVAGERVSADCHKEVETSSIGYIKENDRSCNNLREHDNSKNKSVAPERQLLRITKKLLVLDLNGLLVDILYVSHNSRKADKKVNGKSLFKRPFCDEFLKFCFEAFDIGIWSSRRKYNVDTVVDFLMGERKRNLLFCWDESKCTYTGFNTIENFHKPLVLKELSKIWNKDEHNLLWEKGTYSPSNTLLIDDSPYKALCNPAHTAIFPHPYSFLDENDKCLGPEGNIRVYLEGLAKASDAQDYVKKHPFGQEPITEGHPSWTFYLRIIKKFKKTSLLASGNL